ncbi:MAG: hypothetical protein RIS29_1586 [Bacteroidota bacterium]|jgi:hypothetical protein
MITAIDGRKTSYYIKKNPETVGPQDFFYLIDFSSSSK